ncbi:hypothetical protein [Diaminobutyricimonas aerilata]|nr:hypothetical protein [Diaminobutyricimonas aerilata]
MTNRSSTRATTARCEHGAMCEHTDAGHAASPMRVRLASATPSRWRDATVEQVTAGGWIALALLDGGRVWAWHHAALALQPGAPVALHADYDVLATGDARVSVLRAPEVG